MSNKLGWWLTGATCLAFLLAGIVVLESMIAATTVPNAGTQATSSASAPSEPPPAPPPIEIASAPIDPSEPDPNGVIRVPMQHPRVKPIPSNGNMAPHAIALELKGDIAGARAILEPHVFGEGRARHEEVVILRNICKRERDKLCLETIAQRYPND